MGDGRERIDKVEKGLKKVEKDEEKTEKDVENGLKTKP